MERCRAARTCQARPRASAALERAGSLRAEGFRIWRVRKEGTIRRKHRNHQAKPPPYLKKSRPERGGFSRRSTLRVRSRGAGAATFVGLASFIQSPPEAGGEKERESQRRPPTPGSEEGGRSQGGTLLPRPVPRLGAAGGSYSLSRLCFAARLPSPSVKWAH